ncbi:MULTISPECIES: SCO2322 family protein [Streptomyces]|uniref:SCO2322 family protein n=2 Tax=Streptomyces TaxID=1883 RepID=A0ABU4KIG1_9ACTN|nr:SCO2322 family protein [Streptomyces roseolus]MDX2297561.1 SCO2322 family protein [Streptomyces roseolus]
MTLRTKASGALACGAAGLLLALGAAAPAQAAGYRYWSYWEADGGKWSYANQGPATARPADGDAVGFRFALSEDSSDATRPTAAPDFATVCGGVERSAGTKRIAVVVDFGTPQDAPAGETPPQDAPTTGCARVAENATAADALAAVAKPLRYDSSAMLCGIAGYPRHGCGEAVADSSSATGATAAPKAAEPSDGGPSAGLLVGGGAVLALGAAAVWKSRRRA